MTMKKRRLPSRISERFLSTVMQGQWAESKALEALNESDELIAIQYGQSRSDIFDAEEFKKYYWDMQAQIEKYGKRPDILVFEKSQAGKLTLEDISEKPEEEVKETVGKCIAALECRSSTWYREKYLTAKIGKKSERTDLSFTMKEEDIAILSRWVSTYGKRLYYVQIFFDSAFAIRFDDILDTIKNGKKNKDYFFNSQKKTGKPTYSIPVGSGIKFAEIISEPELKCKSIVTKDGEAMAIRTPEGGRYRLSKQFAEDVLS